ncbi:MAG: 50S ribosomal protein L21, large subunit ribosomal protein L21 [Candidatus Peregrinibacteria bacterium GW2011_GWE2_39_6]|nr:MAG: 50S ribosomal protein L21, large subunit ribosomal protein L21 [Candidatus Peregrinibacteria bacterium GW2011_GWE2_39_6]
MYVIIQIGSTQYKVKEKDEILVDQLKVEEGKNYKIDQVLLCVDEAKKVLIGVLGHEKGEKIRGFKMKAKKKYQRTFGHRSLYTRLRILKINVLNGFTASDAKVAKVLKKDVVLEKKTVIKKIAVKSVKVAKPKKLADAKA